MENEKKISVAIDGPSGAGKSTIARRTARTLGLVYVDTGAIYRTVGYHAYRSGIDPTDAASVAALLPELRISMDYGKDGLQRMYRNGEDVTEQIRLPEISMITSHVSAVPEVRAFLLEMQRRMAREYSVVMDGRDIGTVVLPDADVKIFLTASVEDRARRRYKELMERGTPKGFDELLRERRPHSGRQKGLCGWIPQEIHLSRAFSRSWQSSRSGLDYEPFLPCDLYDYCALHPSVLPP